MRVYQYINRFLIVSIFLIFLLAFNLNSCKNKGENKKKTYTKKELKEPLIKVNKHVLRTEDQHIQDLIDRYKWPVKETGSGLRYFIYKDGTGKKAEKNNIARLNYTLKTITGDLIYNSKDDGILEFQIGKGQVPGGLEEGILLLRVGDKAKFIIPSHLGYGLLGDNNRIPPKATLVYDLELFQLK